MNTLMDSKVECQQNLRARLSATLWFPEGKADRNPVSPIFLKRVSYRPVRLPVAARPGPCWLYRFSACW